MNSHPYWIIFAFIAVAVGFWLISDALLRLDTRHEQRYQRRLDRAEQRRIDRKFGEITGYHDGIERP